MFCSPVCPTGGTSGRQVTARGQSGDVRTPHTTHWPRELMWRHRDPERRLPGEPCLAEDGRVIGAVGLEVDVIVVQPFKKIVARLAPGADEGHAGESHVHVAREQFRVVLHVRLETVAVDAPPSDRRDMTFETVHRPGRDLLPGEADLDIGPDGGSHGEDGMVV